MLMQFQSLIISAFHKHIISQVNICESWNNGMRCMSYYVLMNLWYDSIASWDISCPGGFCPESGPLSLGMQHNYFARYPTEEWHLANLFSLGYFSVVVCLRGLYHYILLAAAKALCQGQCTPHARFFSDTCTVFSDNLRPFTMPIYLLCSVCYHVHCKLPEIKNYYYYY